jgi:hypothetical protein
MATNELTTLRNALYTIINGDSAMQALCGRATGIVVLWRSGLALAAPTVAMLLPSNARIGGDGNRRNVLVLFGCYAYGNGAQDKVEAMTRRIRELLTTTALAGHSIDAHVFVADERGVDPETVDTSAQEARHDLDVVIELQAPL